MPGNKSQFWSNIIKRFKDLTKYEIKDQTFTNTHGNAINDDAELD